MDTSEFCQNCGGARAIHHYETEQCPVGGREAPIGKRQEWKTTVFEAEETDHIAQIKALRDALENVRRNLARSRNYGADRANLILDAEEIARAALEATK